MSTDASQKPGLKTPMDLSEAALWEAWSGNRQFEARERLFSLYFPLALQIAKRHFFEWTGSDLELADLRQAACTGLLEAIDHFDPTRGIPFRGYARGRIRGSVLDSAAKASEVREQIAARARARQERLRSLRHNTEPQDAQADPLQNLMELAVGLALGFMLEGSNLYLDDQQLDTAPNAYDSVAWRETLKRLHKELGALPERERAVLRHHYSGELTFDQIGALVGLSKSRISQIHKDALIRLRLNLTRKPFTVET